MLIQSGAVGRTGGSLLLIFALGAAPASAQLATSAGVTAGTARLTDTRSEQALSGILQFKPQLWLTLSAIPSFVRLSDRVSGRAVSSSGLGDLPLVAGAAQTLRTPWSPSLGAALIVTLPVGDAARGLGTGETAVGADVGAGLSPIDRLHLSAGASRNLSGLAAQSTLSAPHATALRVEGGYDVSRRWTASVSLGADVGQVDSTQALSRMIGAGVAYAIAGPLTVTIDGSHGLTAASPRWVLSVGLGTAFAGTSPVSPTSPLRRLRTGFVGGVNRGSGFGKIGGGR